MNKKRGMTLVEVLVSITIFLTVFMGIISTYYLAEKRIARLEEYQYLENVCLDIDKIYDTEGISGLKNRYKFTFNVDQIAEGEDSYSKERDECEKDDKPLTLDETTDPIKVGDSATPVIETVKDQDGKDTEEKTRTYSTNYLVNHFYKSYDKTIMTTTQKMKNESSGEIYIDSNYKIVEKDDDSCKYTLSYSYSLNYSDVTEVTTEITEKKYKEERYTITTTEHWKKSESDSSSEETSTSVDLTEEEQEQLKGYKITEIKNETGISTIGDYIFQSKTTKTTTVKTKSYEVKTSSLIITITNNLSNYDVISELNYGSSKYDDEYLTKYKDEEINEITTDKEEDNSNE